MVALVLALFFAALIEAALLVARKRDPLVKTIMAASFSLAGSIGLVVDASYLLFVSAFHSTPYVSDSSRPTGIAWTLFRSHVSDLDGVLRYFWTIVAITVVSALTLLAAALIKGIKEKRFRDDW